MRIGIVVPGGVSRDGERKVLPAILWVIERLARSHDVHVVVPEQEPEPDRWSLLGATIHNLGTRARGWQVRAVATFMGLHRRLPFDVFHAFWANGPGEVAVSAARLCRRRALVHVAGGELVWIPRAPYGTRRALRRAITGRVIRGADRVSAASRPMIDLIAASTGVRADRIPLGVDLAHWSRPGPRPRQTRSPARLVSVGSLTPVKDHPTLLRAVSHLIASERDVSLDLVGLDTSKGVVPRLVRELGIDAHVRLHGFLTQAEARELVANADILVVSSLHEAGPVAMLEAAAAGVAIIGTPVGHVLEWAPHAAVAVPFGDPEGMSQAIADLLDDEAKRVRLATAAHQLALAEDADWTSARFVEIYEQLRALDRGGRKRDAPLESHR